MEQALVNKQPVEIGNGENRDICVGASFHRQPGNVGNYQVDLFPAQKIHLPFYNFQPSPHQVQQSGPGCLQIDAEVFSVLNTNITGLGVDFAVIWVKSAPEEFRPGAADVREDAEADKLLRQSGHPGCMSKAVVGNVNGEIEH
ncbi:MAG TPA: hypothetical protein P5170_04670 [Candidatus Syntrophosphaera sp.]|nr:MAG: hypothetical protein BWX83_01260 [Candidatus Cloacimonetes bacterium ADurb.Bin117]HRT60211.1 hypothetical protein [Candidatus Syntrophosphaera sp.]